MCNNQNKDKSIAEKQAEFYKHLRTYLTIVAIFFMYRVFFQGHIGIPSFAFWWGIGVLVHYVSVFGWDKLEGNHVDRAYFEDEPDEREAEPLVDQRMRDRSWRDRDLV